MDQELVKSLRLDAARFPHLAELSESTAAILIDHLANIYLKDPSVLLWWESLKLPAKIVPYGDGNGIQLMRNEVASERAFLLVSDESSSPWLVFRGRTADLLEVIAEQRFFEYCLVAEDMSQMAFDTHHNEIVIAASASPVHVSI